MRSRAEANPDFTLLYSIDTHDLIASVNKLQHDNSPSGTRFSTYVSALNEIFEERNNLGAKFVSKRLINLLKEMVYTALSEHNINVSHLIENSHITLCVAGPLAQAEATPFSHIDSFMLLDDKLDTEQQRKIKAVMESVFNITRVLFAKTGQFGMDEAGLNIATLTGTTEELNEKMSVLHSSYSFNMMKAISVLSGEIGSEQLEVFKIGLAEKNETINHITPQLVFRRMIKEFTEPNWQNTTCDIKRDILRPIDMVMQGFKVLYNLSSREYSTTQHLLKRLLELNAIETHVRDLIAYLKKEPIKLSNKYKAMPNNEFSANDKKEKTQKNMCLIRWLIGSLAQWINTDNMQGPLKLSDIQNKNCIDLTPSIKSQSRQLMLINEAIISFRIKLEVARTNKGLFRKEDKFTITLLEQIITDLKEMHYDIFKSMLDGPRVNVEERLMEMQSQYLKLSEDDHNRKYTKVYTDIRKLISIAIEHNAQLGQLDQQFRP